MTTPLVSLRCRLLRASSPRTIPIPPSSSPCRLRSTTSSSILSRRDGPTLDGPRLRRPPPSNRRLIHRHHHLHHHRRPSSSTTLRWTVMNAPRVGRGGYQPASTTTQRGFSSSSEGSSHSFVLSHPSDVDDNDGGPTPEKRRRGRIICITSGKGGVGKTTSAASFASGLASRGHPTVCVDFDIGLRNLDIHLGVERRVIFDIVHVLNGECTLGQALIKDRSVDGLHMLAASQTRDKDALTIDGVERVLAELSERFDYVVLDSPAGIESGARHAMYFCDDAIVVTNPEMSSCRDADKMIGFVSSRSRRAELGDADCAAVSQTLLVTRYDPDRAEAEESLSIADVKDLLGLPVIGVVPESKDVLTCTNLGKPVIALGEDNPAAGAYMDMVDRYLGQEKELRFVTPEPVSFFKRIFG